MQHWEWNWLKKYNINGPRYTSYPTALSFHESVNTATCQNVVAEYQSRSRSISIYRFALHFVITVVVIK